MVINFLYFFFFKYLAINFYLILLVSKKRKLSTSTSIDKNEEHSSSTPFSNSPINNENDFRTKEQEVLNHLSFLKENRKKEMRSKKMAQDSETESSSSLTNKDMLAKFVENVQTSHLNDKNKEFNLSDDSSFKQINSLLLKPQSAQQSIKDALDLSLPNRSRLANSEVIDAANSYKFPQIYSSEVSLSPLSYTSSNLSVKVAAADAHLMLNESNKAAVNTKCKQFIKKSPKMRVDQLEKSLNNLKSKGFFFF